MITTFIAGTAIMLALIAAALAIAAAALLERAKRI